MKQMGLMTRRLPVVVLGGIDGESGTTGDLIVGEASSLVKRVGCLYTSRQ